MSDEQRWDKTRDAIDCPKCHKAVSLSMGVVLSDSGRTRTPTGRIYGGCACGHDWEIRTDEQRAPTWRTCPMMRDCEHCKTEAVYTVEVNEKDLCGDCIRGLVSNLAGTVAVAPKRVDWPTCEGHWAGGAKVYWARRNVAGNIEIPNDVMQWAEYDEDARGITVPWQFYGPIPAPPGRGETDGSS